MSKINYIVKRISSKLQLGDCPDAKETEKIIDGIKDMFDRFSIDSRKLPIVQEFEFPITSCDTRQAIGNSGSLHMCEAPHTLYYAAWRHKPSCGCTYDKCCDLHNRREYRYWVGDERIEIRSAVQEFYRENPQLNNGHLGYFRPTEIWYQQSTPNGELVFNTPPLIGDTLYIRATVPFCVELANNCCEDKSCPEPDWEFIVCPSNKLSCDEKHRVIHQAQSNFTGDPCFKWETRANTCEPCPSEIWVNVTVKPKPRFYPNCVDIGTMELPNGYTDAIIKIVAYDIAEEFGISSSFNKLQAGRNQAIALIQRDNERKRPRENEYKDPANFFNNRRRSWHV